MSSGRTYWPLNHWIWSLDTKDMAFETSQLHCLQNKTPKHFSNLSSSNAHSINEHTKTDTCHKSMLSPNNLKLKLIIILGKCKHLYSMVEMKALKGQNFVWLSNPKGLLNPQMCFRVAPFQNLKPFPPFPLLSPPIDVCQGSSSHLDSLSSHSNSHLWNYHIFFSWS